MVDASNAFNSINREAFLHKTKIICPSLSTYNNNRYSTPSKLYIQGGISLKSEEGTTQGDPTAMAIYTLGITPLIAWLSKKSKENTNSPPINQVAFADDLNGIGTLFRLKEWWKLLEERKKFGYNVNPGKSYLIVKEQCKEKAIKLFENSRIKITTEGHRHLGSVIGSRQFSENYIGLLVSRWCEEITELLLIPKTATSSIRCIYCWI